MARLTTVRVSRFVALFLWSALCTGQEVHVARGNGTVSLSVVALKPYPVMSGEEKFPILSVECAHKGKKTGHIIAFSAGGTLIEEAKAQLIFNMTISGARQMTPWVPYGDTITYAYFAKTDAERVKFIQSLLDSGKVSIEFKPFMTGAPTTSVFDLSKLRGEMDKSPECAETPTK